MAEHVGGGNRRRADAECQCSVRRKSAATRGRTAGRGPAGRATGPRRRPRRAAARAQGASGLGRHTQRPGRNMPSPHAWPIVERLGYESGLWDTFIRTDSHIIFNQAQKTDGTPASGGPSLSNVDGIFFLGHRDVPITDQQKAELAGIRSRRQGLRRGAHGAHGVRIVAGVRRNARRRLRGPSLHGPGPHDQRAAGTSHRQAWGTTADYSDESTARRACRGTRSTWCFGSIRRARRRRDCRQTVTFPSSGPRATGKAASSTVRCPTDRGVGHPQRPAHDVRSDQVVPGPDRAPVQPHALREPAAAR